MRRSGSQKKYGKPIDGHAPGLRRHELQKYISAGITTDHETLSREEAIEKIGSLLHAPFMTLSFMALPVIPKLKLTDKGLFDAEQFMFVSTFVNPH